MFSSKQLQNEIQKHKCNPNMQCPEVKLTLLAMDMEGLGRGLPGLKHKTKEAFYMHCSCSSFTLEILFSLSSASGKASSGDFTFLPCKI